jgi:chemotaxis signal transduction protein/chemotaxis methyl-accepting protein methylase
MEQTKIRENTAQTEQIRVDFKMVTFTLAGKDYGIDIMKVKEISKAAKFTFVPNAAPFVKGVYNLRGDIISVIDLRTFFNLPIEDSLEEGNVNMIILRLEGHVLSVVVDTIDKVVGIASENVQPPHPLFGDINIKYINGVVENDGRLYVILDVERIFGSEEPSETARDQERRPGVGLSGGAVQESTVASTENVVKEEVDIGFIEETLVTFLSFYSSPINQDWIRSRFSTWKKQRGDEVQLTNIQDAEAFLSPFWSPFTGNFWSVDYLDKVAALLPSSHNGNYYVWNPGCGSGHESYSIAVTIKKAMPSVNLKIIAHDSDLIRISTAPGLSVDPGIVKPPYEQFLIEGARGMQFSKEIKDSILFEYHDITHDNTLPKLDLVVMRDTLSYLAPESQGRTFELLDEVMKPGSLLILGVNEQPINSGAWDRIEKDGVVAYKKK